MATKKEEATTLRKAGYSYSIISKKINVSKSTLSNWLTNIPFRPNKTVLDQVGRAHLKSALYKQKIKFQDIAQRKLEAVREVGKFSQRDLFMLGIGIYLGEGSKAFEQVRIANADPMIIKIAIQWFKEFCKIETKNLKITIHGYPDNNLQEMIQFWSEQTGIPHAQFNKTVIDTRLNKSTNKKRILPYGTAHLYIVNGGTLVLGVKSIHRKIIGWIEATTKQV